MTARLRKYFRQSAGAGLQGRQADLAALDAVERRTSTRLTDVAMAAALGTGRIKNAATLLRHHPDLVVRVRAGELPLGQAAVLGRLRREAPDLADLAEARLTGRRTITCSPRR